MIFMTHPEHGATNVLPGEVAEHEKNGWVLDTHENWLGKKFKKNEPIQEKRKPGRPRKAE